MTIPKRPLATSKAKKTLPVTLDWGKGIPKDHLAYINAREAALIKLNRSTKAKRSHKGVPAYADDSASSKGVERGADGPSGVGRGSSGGSSTSGTKPSSSTSTSSPSSSSSGSKAAPSSPAPAASTSHASTTNGTQARTSVAPSKAPTAANTAPIGSKAPNVAAQVASDRLRQSSQTAGAKPSSVQGMINAQASAQIAPNGSYYGPKGPTTGLNAAAYAAANRSPQTAPNGSYYGPKGPSTGLNTDARFAAARSVGFDPAPVKRTPGDAATLGRMMMAESARIRNQYGKVSVPGMMGVGEVVRNRMMSDRYPNTVGGVLNQRSQFSPMGDGSFARTPENATATRVAESILSGESPPTVGTSLNYGNLDTINNKPGYSSPATKAAFNSMPVEARIADARSPNTFSHSFGTIDGPSDVAFNTGGHPTSNSGGAVGLAAAAAAEPSPAPPQGIPSPNSVGIMPGSFQGPAMRDPAAARASGLMQSFAPQAAPSPMRDPQAAQGTPNVSAPNPDDMMGSPPGYFSQFAMTSQDMDAMKKQAMKDFSFGELMTMQKNQDALPGLMGPITNDVNRMANQPPAAPQAPAPQAPQPPMPNMRPPSQNMSPPPGAMQAPPQAPPAGPNRVLGAPPQPQGLPGFSPPAGPNHSMGAPAPSGPSTYSPQAGPGDEEPTYAENPSQGPSNPMQEAPAVEDPAVVKERQNKYAQRGAAIGGIVAGPIGTLVGATLGYQMGKTNPAQRQAIASNPAALNANAQSINQMVEERGGKNDPNMRVRPEALKDVLTNPSAVASQPEKYTSLEQMLAALAMGVNPETGKTL